MKSEILGSALHVSKNSGNLIVRTEQEVQIGENVYDKRGKKVGRVFDIFGPVDRPYVAIKGIGEVDRLVGKTVYVNKKTRGKKTRY